MSYECPKCKNETVFVSGGTHTGCIFCGAPFATKCPNCLRQGFIATEQVCYLCDYDAKNDPNNFSDPDPVQEYSTEDENI